MFKIKIIGAGQLGSRHLQAMKGVEQLLDIQVIDPSENSLRVAKERYEAVSGGQEHRVSFCTEIGRAEGGTDIAIIATNSDVRRKAIESLLDASETRLLVLEKLLFRQREDYAAMESRLNKAGVKVWVNCPMRVMPIYEKIRADFKDSPLSYRVTGSQFGLVTNAIHYIDHVAHLSGCEEFEIDVIGLDRVPIPSKRAGFLEVNGTLIARFADGSRCEVTCYPSGSAPVIVEIFNQMHRYFVRESEGKFWHAGEEGNWAWEEQAAPIPYQSQLTTAVIESLLATGDCGLTPYAISSRIHQQLLDPLAQFVREQFPETAGYPFT